MATLVCLKCGVRLSEDELPDDPTETVRCRGCHGSAFVACVDRAWTLSENDTRFLRSIRVGPN